MKYLARVWLTGVVLCTAGATAAAHTAARPAAQADRQPMWLSFMGRRYFLYHTERKGIGVSTLYSPSRKHRGKARDTLVINYTLSHSAGHSVVTAHQVADTMYTTFRAMHAPWAFPFAVPDRHSPGHFIYFVSALLLLPAQRETELIMARVRAPSGGKWIVDASFIRTHPGHWSGETKMGKVLAPDMRWLKQHMKAVAGALTKLRAPPSPPHPG